MKFLICDPDRGVGVDLRFLTGRVPAHCHKACTLQPRMDRTARMGNFYKETQKRGRQEGSFDANSTNSLEWEGGRIYAPIVCCRGGGIRTLNTIKHNKTHWRRIIYFLIFEI
jgi:hypothetical protein